MCASNFNRDNVLKAFYQFINIQYPADIFPECHTEAVRKKINHTAGLTLKELLCYLKYVYFDELNLHELKKAESILRQYLFIRDNEMFKEFGDSFDIENVFKAYSYLVTAKYPEDLRDRELNKHAVFLTHEEVLCFLKYWYLEAFRNDDYDEAESLLRQYQLIHDNSIFKDLDTMGL